MKALYILFFLPLTFSCKTEANLSGNDRIATCEDCLTLRNVSSELKDSNLKLQVTIYSPFQLDKQPQVRVYLNDKEIDCSSTPVFSHLKETEMIYYVTISGDYQNVLSELKYKMVLSNGRVYAIE